MLNASVSEAQAENDRISRFLQLSADSCKVKNGDCHVTAQCSHDPVTFAVKCICRTGYTNTGSGSTVVCTGMCHKNEHSFHFHFEYWQDSCQVNSGGCDVNAICSHDNTTNAVVCTCRPGFTNTGTNDNVKCTGLATTRHEFSWTVSIV
jgi:hypothetical protein